MPKNTNPNQIYKKMGAKTFVELLDTYFSSSRLIINFERYDKNRPIGNRKTEQIMIYMTFQSVLRTTYSILTTGSLLRDLDMTPQSSITLSQGGTSAKKLQRYQKSRQDGNGVYRLLEISKGSKVPYVLTAKSGPGMEQGKGLIVPIRGSKPDAQISVGFSMNDLIEFALMMQNSISAFMAAKYVFRVYNPDKDFPSIQAHPNNTTSEQSSYSQNSQTMQQNNYNQQNYE
jgi:hypothetical protein